LKIFNGIFSHIEDEVFSTIIKATFQEMVNTNSFQEMADNRIFLPSNKKQPHNTCD